MQLNLVGLNVSAKTNAAYLPAFNFWNFVLTRNIPPLQATESKRKKFLYANAVLDGPAFMISKNRFGAGVFARARTVADIRRLPYQLTDLFLNTGNANPDETGEVNVHNARLTNMSWVEYGVNLGYMVYRRKNEMITAGINIKYLTGINLLFLNFADVTGTYSSKGIDIANLEGKYRYAAPAFGSGKGWGGDLGITYKKMLSQVDGYLAHSKRSHCKFVDYKYKLGLSLRDAGYIKFRGNTTKADLQGSGLLGSNTDGVPGIENTFSVSTSVGEKITAMTPMALSAQLDYNFENNFYVNATLNKNLVPNAATGVQSMDLLSVTPRFETRMVEIALPLTMQKFIYPQVGFAFRFRSFELGFDNVLPLVMKRNTSGVGVYFNLALSIFRNPGCGSSGGGKVDDCGHYKNPKRKIRRKNSMISPRPRRETRSKTH
jgi:hypothetical protein